MNGLIFVSSKNTPGKHDASGAFIPEALAFKKYHNISDENFSMIDCTKSNSPSNRRKLVLQKLDQFHHSLDLIAFFGHGWPSGIQFGFNKNTVELLANYISSSSKTNLKIAIYACLTAENNERDTKIKNIGPATNNGFADLLRDKISEYGILDGWIDAHKTAGHTTYNPYVVRFYCNKDDTGIGKYVGGSWIVEPNSRYWLRWVKSLKENKNNLRYTFPLMEEMHIKASLDKSWMESWLKKEQENGN